MMMSSIVHFKSLRQNNATAAVAGDRATHRLIDEYFKENDDLWRLPSSSSSSPSIDDRDLLAYDGIIRFHDPTKQEQIDQFAKFLRIPSYYDRQEFDNDEDVRKAKDDQIKKGVFEIMLGNSQLWNMPKPPLIIEITGGAQLEPTVDSEAIKTLRRNLVHAVSTTGAWIVTGGSHRGVMRLVGDEVARARTIDKKNMQIICLGIATWGVIKNRDEMLTSVTHPSLEYHQYEIDNSDDFETPLNSGHNYFIFVDSGVKKYGQEIYFRSQLISYIASKVFLEKSREFFLNYYSDVATTLGISEQTLSDLQEKLDYKNMDETQIDELLLFNNAEPRTDEASKLFSEYVKTSVNVHIPIVLLALGGGRGTLETIEHAINGRQRHQNPVVIPTGFGGVTDLIADLLDEMVEIDEKRQSSNQRQRLIDFIKSHRNFERALDAGGNEEADRTKKAARLFDCIKKASDDNLITVVKPETSASASMVLSTAILNAVFRTNLYRSANSSPLFMHYMARLTFEMARRWNLPASAAEIMREHEQVMRMKTRKILLFSNNEYRQRTTAFFQRMMCDALEQGQHEFVSLLLNRNEDAPAEFFLEKSKRAELFAMTLLKSEKAAKRREVILLCNCIMDDLIDDDEEAFRSAGSFFADKIRCFLASLFDYDDDGEKSAYLTNYRDIFLLELSLNKTEIAVCLWRHGRDLIGTALIASILLAKLGSKADQKNMQELSTIYQQNSIEWQDRAVALLNKCNATYPERTISFLTRNLRTWQNLSVMDIAYFGERRLLAQHPDFKRKVNYIWHGRILASHSSLRIYLAALLFPLGPLLVRFIKLDERHRKHDGFSTADASMFFVRSLKPSLSQCTSSNGDHSDQPLINNNHGNFCYHHGVRETMPFLEAFVEFYFKSPMVRFFWHTVFTILFLLTFTAFILRRDTPIQLGGPPSRHEIVVLFWSACVLVDIFHENFGEALTVSWNLNKKKKGNKTTTTSNHVTIFWRSFLSDRFNILQWRKADFNNVYLPLVLAVMLPLAVSFHVLLPLTAVPKQNLIVSRTLYSLCCLIFWVRSLRVFYISHDVGIIVVTLAKLIPTILYFLLVYFCLLISFSMPIYSLMSPFPSSTEQPSSDYSGVTGFLRLFIKIIYNRHWNLVATDMDNSLSMVEGSCSHDDELVDGDKEPPDAFITANNNTSAVGYMPIRFNYDIHTKCQGEFSFLNVILFATYIILTNIAWMNVLIAILSQTTAEIWSRARQLSNFNHLTAVRTTYYTHWRPLPPPFNAVTLIVMAFYYYYYYYWWYRKNDHAANDYDTDFRVFYENKEPQIRLDEIERDSADKVLEDEKSK